MLASAVRSGVSSIVLAFVALAVPSFAAGCSAPPPELGDPSTEEPADENADAAGEAFTVAGRTGQRFATTARLNFREGPSKSETIQRVLPRGAIVTTIRPTPQNGFFQVSQDGDEGWVHGAYLRSATSSGGEEEEAPSTSPSSSGGTPTGQVETCKASFYAEGQQTANGERFDPSAMTAAHKTLRFNTRVRVTNTANGRAVTVRINDRGPFVAGRCIDLSRAAFSAIASTSQGVASVRVEVLQ